MRIASLTSSTCSAGILNRYADLLEKEVPPELATLVQELLDTRAKGIERPEELELIIQGIVELQPKDGKGKFMLVYAFYAPFLFIAETLNMLMDQRSANRAVELPLKGEIVLLPDLWPQTRLACTPEEFATLPAVAQHIMPLSDPSPS